MKDTITGLSFILLTFCYGNFFPSDGIQLSYTNVLFQWEALEGATVYNFQLSEDPSFNSTLVDISISELFYLSESIIDWDNLYYCIV